MNLRTLAARSLRFHWRSHVGVVLGAAVATTVLVGALVVGDSVRWSLRRMALARLGQADVAMLTPETMMRSALADEITAALGPAATRAAAVLQLRGIAAREDGTARVNEAQVVGVDGRFWAMAPTAPLFANDETDVCAVSTRTARALGVGPGDRILVRVRRPSALALDAPLSGEADSVALRVTVKAVAGDDQFGRFSLAANQVPPHGVFLPLAYLQRRLGPTLAGRANVLLAGGGAAGPITADRANAALARCWQLADAQLELRPLAGDAGVELRSGRVFLDPALASRPVVAAPGATGVLTYFVNELRVGAKTTPYSMVTAVGPLGAATAAPADPLLVQVAPPAMADDEVTVNAWLAEDLGAKVGDDLAMTYFVPGPAGRLETRTSRFRIRAVVPLEGPAADPTLMPDFPGIADVGNCRDWKPGLDIDLARIRDKDQAYWDAHRGTPKAFVTLAAGRRMWANRFGDLTAVRYPGPGGAAQTEALAAALRKGVPPASLGLFFRPVREQALAASGQAMDFGQLFLGLSFFLMAAALVLTALLFAFGAQQRAEETGMLLAVGFAPKRVRRLMLMEAAVLTLIGAAAGTVGGLVYTRAVLYALATVWQGAVGASDIVFHVEPLTLALGAAAGVVVDLGAIYLTLRRQARAPARELLAAGPDAQLRAALRPRAWPWPSAAVLLAAAAGAVAVLAAVGWTRGRAQAGAFLGAGALLLVAALALGHLALAVRARLGAARRLTLAGLALRNLTRRRGRSMATIAIVACGVFLVAAIGANYKSPPEDPGVAASGTGGFRLFGETAMPIREDLLGRDGLKAYALPADLPSRVRAVVPMRVHEGDDASCLNLNRVQQPRLAGVRPEALAARGAFTFTETVPHPAGKNPWLLLARREGPDVVPCIGDAATIQWSIGKAVGEEVPYTDERGRAFRLRIVGAVAGSILQGMLVIGEDAFIERFPGDSGYRMLLVDTPADQADAVAAVLSDRLADVGLAVTATARRLADFGAMQNTYLVIFQTLGGLGLVLGSLGLGVVVLRNVLERRGELALMRAVGFRRRAIAWMVLGEHWDLLAGGLVCGLVPAWLAVAPVLAGGGAAMPYGLVGLTLAAVAASGMLWTYLATRVALRGPLLEALRNE